MTNPSTSSLAEVVKQVAEQQLIQASEIEKSRAILEQLQNEIQDLQAQINCVNAERKATERHIYHQDELLSTIKDNCENLETQITALNIENVKLKFDTETSQEEFKTMLLSNRAYYEKIAAHKHKFGEAETKLPLMIELTKKRAAIKDLITNKVILTSALQNPEGNATIPIQDEIAYLEDEINVLKEAIGEKINALEEEKNMHARLRKEIEVQNKRCEAILKRLYCQVNCLQSSKRQRQWNIQQMEEKVAELRKLLGITN